jgi:hypothetical protein
MTRATVVLSIALALPGGRALAQTPSPSRPAPPAPAAKAAAPAAPAPVRIRIALGGTYAVAAPSYSETRQVPEYAETTTIAASYEAKAAFGADAALQVTLFRGLGVEVGYTALSRDVTGSVSVSRPHPLYLNRPRAASAELSGYGAKENALHLDLAYAGSQGHLDWSVFAGATLFSVDADLLGTPTYAEAYPYDELQIASLPSTSVKESKTGWNVGGRLDYRFGAAGHFGAGVQLRYSAATVELGASKATTPASYDAGGFQVGAGLRLYF